VVLRLSEVLAGVFDESVIVCLVTTFLHRWVGAFTPPPRTFSGNLTSFEKAHICFPSGSEIQVVD